MTAPIILYALMLSSFDPTRHFTDGEIKWVEGRMLTYNDFQGKVPTASPWAALTSSNIYFTYSTANGRLSDFRVYASFIAENSWMKIENEDVLAHEQLHFDITEIFARKLYLEADLLKTKSGSVPKLASDLFKNINKDCDAMQQQYDDETSHGTKSDKQIEWAKKIALILSNHPSYPASGQ